MSDESIENVKGTAKEVAGKFTGSDELAKEGEAQQKKAQTSEEADRLQEQAMAKQQEAASHEDAERARQG